MDLDKLGHRKRVLAREILNDWFCVELEPEDDEGAEAQVRRCIKVMQHSLLWLDGEQRAGLEDTIHFYIEECRKEATGGVRREDDKGTSRAA